jgi:hypothetical protein
LQRFGTSVACTTIGELASAGKGTGRCDRIASVAALISAIAMVQQSGVMALRAAIVEMLRLEPGWLTCDEAQAQRRLVALFKSCRTDMRQGTSKPRRWNCTDEEHRAIGNTGDATHNMLLARRAVVAAGRWPLPAQDTLMLGSHNLLAEAAFKHLAGLAERVRGMVARGVRKLCAGDKTYEKRVLRMLMHTSLPDEYGVSQYTVRDGDVRLQRLVARRDRLFTEARQQLDNRSEAGWHSTPDEIIRSQRGMVSVHLFSAWATEISGEAVLRMEAPSFVEIFVPHNMGYVTVGARGRQTAIARWATKNADALATSFNTERLERSGLEQQDGKWVANEELLLAIERFNAHFKKRYGVKKAEAFVAAAQEHTLDFLERALMLQPNGWAKMGLGAACMPTARLCSDGFRLRWDYCDLRRPKYWCMSKEAAKADGRYRPGEPVWDECSEVVDAQKGTLWWRRLQLLTASTGRQGPALLVSSLPHGQDFAGDSKSRTSADQGGLGGECSPACSSGQCADPAQARPALSAHRRRLPRRMRPGARCTT